MTRREEELGSLWGVGSARPRGDTDGKEGKRERELKWRMSKKVYEERFCLQF